MQTPKERTRRFIDAQDQPNNEIGVQVKFENLLSSTNEVNSLPAEPLQESCS